jgi:NAD(P)-dependent dehydrogenase (short-subunit alcohol dehydrogenase family)
MRPVALVTGAAGGIGRAVVERLDAEGWDVVPSDRDGAGTDPRLLPCDVTDEGSVAALVAAALERHGRLDAVVTCAGVIDVAPVVRMTRAQWDRVMTVNMTGTFLVVRDALPALSASPRGRVVCIASDAGKTGEPGIAHYCASKFAVVGFVQSLALELATTTVTANSVCPVICDTAMMESLAHDYADAMGEGDVAEWRSRFVAEIPMGRAATPDDVAHAVAYLVDERSAFVTGQALNVSGGHEVH